VEWGGGEGENGVGKRRDRRGGVARGGGRVKVGREMWDKGRGGR